MEGDSSGVWRFLPDACVGLGVALGVANLAAPQASGWLRVPALLAALILVAQGLLGIQERGAAAKKKAEAEQASRRESVAASDQSSQGRVITSSEVVIHDSRQSGGRVAVGQSTQAPALAAPAGAGTPVRENRGPMFAVLLLAIWLGLATLNYSHSPAYLLGLSLVASSLLFTSAWNMLQTGA